VPLGSGAPLGNQGLPGHAARLVRLVTASDLQWRSWCAVIARPSVALRIRSLQGAAERLPIAPPRSEFEKVRSNYSRKVMVEGKGFVFASPLTSRHLSTPTLQIAAKRGKPRARTRPVDGK